MRFCSARPTPARGRQQIGPDAQAAGSAKQPAVALGSALRCQSRRLFASPSWPQPPAPRVNTGRVIHGSSILSSPPALPPSFPEGPAPRKPAKFPLGPAVQNPSQSRTAANVRWFEQQLLRGAPCPLLCGRGALYTARQQGASAAAPCPLFAMR
jgi:hypothetical protein